MRLITDHKVNGLNDSLDIAVLDEPGQGNACHNYEIELPSSVVAIKFQNGPIKEFGVNGISNEALLAIVIDRLRCFQSGQFACLANSEALELLDKALYTLHTRTKERLARNVEGTNIK